MDTSTIAAIATPIGSGGIGIIRISGPEAMFIAASLFVPSSARKSGEYSADFESHRLYHGHITDAEKDQIVDEVLLVFMKAPRSYTREDVAEIHAHSGPAVLKTILELVLKKGARLAEPGEFTRRAFLNGRIDLTQAEAVIDIISAGTEKAMEAAASQMKGYLKQQISEIREILLNILVQTEAAIDFPEDAGEEIPVDNILEILHEKVRLPLKKLANRYDDAHILREGLRLIIAGKPNVGKSSLMNRLLRKDRAIVTPIPGTTRDMIEENLVIRGIPVVLIDTAGLHESDDPVEKIGMEKSRERIQNADLLLFMTDMEHPLSSEDYDIFRNVSGKKLIWVINKSDLASDREPEVPESWQDMPRIMISAKYDHGIGELKDLIAETVLKSAFACENAVIPNIRHKQAIEKSLHAVNTAKEGIENSIPFELISMDIREAADLLGEIIGITVREDVLDRIFSTFCIGK
ncbi:MAG: tRNA uridine-5-carboxymethylaminomethyl(34) synthesis GTPase MnmE [Desulfococcaceae bacterium]